MSDSRIPDAQMSEVKMSEVMVSVAKGSGFRPTSFLVTGTDTGAGKTTFFFALAPCPFPDLGIFQTC